MELKWLEDFLSLAETLNFSRAAEARHVTQPAFSRRIRCLEEWIGTDLLDRSSYPISLTPAGKMFRGYAQEFIEKTYKTRTLLRGDTASDSTVHFTAPHALVLNFLSEWILEVGSEFGPLIPKITATNSYEGLLSLVEGQSSDFAVVYHHRQIPIALPGNRYPYLTLRHDALVPVVSSRATLRLPGTKSAALPFIAYPASLFMGQLVELVLARAPQPAHLSRFYETDLLEAARAMVLAGRGIAWIPRDLVAAELARGELVLAGAEPWSEPLDVRLYYSLENRRATPARLWEFLTRRVAAEPAGGLRQ